MAGSAEAKVHHHEPKTEAAVIAADDDWLAAERRGDVASLDARLADIYRDVESNGRAHPKSELLSATARRKDIWPGTAAEVAAAFRKKYPVVMKVVIAGDTAILSFHSTDSSLESYIGSEDVFTYQNGMWKGVLSNHLTPPRTASS